jgi:HD-like signal output (HDOD) protein
MSSAASVKLSTSVLEELWFGEDDPKASDDAAAASLAARLAELEGLRPFPAVVQRVMAYVNHPDFDIRKLETMIEEDPALAAKVLRVANSAAFAGSQPVNSIREAAVRLGARQISDVTASIAAMAMFKDVKGLGRIVRDHMVTSAMLVRVLGSRKETASASGYLSGLLHDMGKLLLLQTEDEAYETALSKITNPDESHLRERELLGYDHAVLGGHALKMWGMPDPIPRAVAWHHQPVRAYEAGGDIGMTVALIRVADQIEPLLKAQQGLDSPKLKRIIANADCAHAGLRERDFVALWTDLEEAHRNALKMFA